MGRQESNANVIAYPPRILVAFVILGLLIHPFWLRHLAAWPLSISLGLAAGIASAALALWARKQFLGMGTPIDPSLETTAVVTTGPYAFTRNPLYIAQGLLLVMASCLVNSVAMLAMLLPWLTVIRLGVIRREERYLTRKFGEGYESYRRRVRCWL